MWGNYNFCPSRSNLPSLCHVIWAIVSSTLCHLVMLRTIAMWGVDSWTARTLSVRKWRKLFSLLPRLSGSEKLIHVRVLLPRVMGGKAHRYLGGKPDQIRFLPNPPFCLFRYSTKVFWMVVAMPCLPWSRSRCCRLCKAVLCTCITRKHWESQNWQTSNLQNWNK